MIPISVKDRLPDKYRNVLIFTTRWEIGAYDERYGWFDDWGPCNSVTHWMELPPEPKESNDNTTD